jgi:Protein of unknown function (DUF3616)
VKKIAFLLATLLIAEVVVGDASGRQVKKDKKQKPMAGSPINGGPFEASGAVYVPGTDSVLFIDDGRPDEILLMQVDQSGQQVGTARALKLGARVENPEGITFDGAHFYVVGSQSIPKRAEQNAVARFVFDPNAQTITGVEVIKDLRGLLLAKVAALQVDGGRKGADGGLNIEGIAWDPLNNRLLLGLRSPIKDGRALVLPIKLRDAGGPFSADNLDLADSRPIELSLAGSGIRDIQYDSNLKSFLLISGAPENQIKGEFILWQWDGTSQPRQVARLDSNIKPEGVTGVKLGGGYILMVGDANRYLKFNYSEVE